MCPKDNIMYDSDEDYAYLSESAKSYFGNMYYEGGRNNSSHSNQQTKSAKYQSQASKRYQQSVNRRARGGGQQRRGMPRKLTQIVSSGNRFIDQWDDFKDALKKPPKKDETSEEIVNTRNVLNKHGHQEKMNYHHSGRPPDENHSSPQKVFPFNSSQQRSKKLPTKHKFEEKYDLNFNETAHYGNRENIQKHWDGIHANPELLKQSPGSASMPSLAEQETMGTLPSIKRSAGGISHNSSETSSLTTIRDKRTPRTKAAVKASGHLELTGNFYSHGNKLLPTSDKTLDKHRAKKAAKDTIKIPQTHTKESFETDISMQFEKQLDLETEEPSNQPQYIIPKKRKGKKKKPDGRAQPTNDDKMDFLVALHDAAAGHLPTQMLYFYKYLVKHGEEDGFPLIDKDMFFYCEVKKFKDAHHAYSDEEMLKRKVQSIMDCYLESATPPALQIDISSDLQQRTLRQAQRYVAGKDVNATVFDDAQYQVFKELLPFWAGFVKKYEPPQDETKKPLTRLQRDRLRRLEEIQHWKPPSARTAILPSLPKGSTVAALTFTLMDGVKWRDMDMEGHPVTGDFEGDMEEVGLTAATNMGRKASMRRGSILSVPSSIISDAPSNNSTIVSKA